MFEAIAYYINMSWVYWGLTVLYGVTVAGIIAVVVSENRNPVKSLAWVTVLMLLPVMGVVLYIFFGRSIKNTRMISRRNRRRLKKNTPVQSIDINRLPLSDESKQQIVLARSLTASPLYTTDTVEIFTNGHDKFEALERDLRSATRYINLQYYIFEDDNTGRRIRDILIERARAGVKVRVIYDHVGSIGVPNRFFREMNEAGIMCYPFFRVNFPLIATRVNWRNHRKLCIIDGNTGYIGGMNIADRYIEGVSYGVWRDTHVRIKGPAVGGLQYAFAVDWSFMGQSLLDESANTSRRNKPRFNSGIQMMTSGPTSQWSNIAMVFQKAIANARKRVFIQTPYFLPTESLLRTLQTVALAKVDVRLMLPAKSDSKILTYASYSYIMECMLAGIKVYLYDAGMLHAKTVIVDDEFSSVGSANIDFRSFEHNFESNIFIYSREVNSELSDIFFEDLDNCTRLSPSMWRKRPAWQKAKESMFRLLSPVL